MNKIPEAPSLDKLTKFANLLDFIGEHDDAELLDQYIETIAYLKDHEIIKQAGLWGNIWKRLKGGVKKLFISEFRDLYEHAAKSQKLLEERAETIKEDLKIIKTNFKNYDFNEWRENIARLNNQGLYTSDIMQGFENKYAEFVNYVSQHFEGKSSFSPEEIAKMEKMTIGDREESVVGDVIKKFEKESIYWIKSDGQNKSIQSYINDPDVIRIMKAFYNSWSSVEKQHIVGVSGEQNVVSFNFKSKLKTPPNLKEVFKNFKWKILGSHDEYVYLKKDGQLKEMEFVEAPKEVGPISNRDIPKEVLPFSPGDPVGHQVQKEPEFDKPKETPGDITSSHTVIKDPPKDDLGSVVKSKPISTPTKEFEGDPSISTREIKGKDDLEIADISSVPGAQKDLEEAEKLSAQEPLPIQGKPENTIWVNYKGTNFYAPIKEKSHKLDRHVSISDPTIISKLDILWSNRENKRKIELRGSFKNRMDKIISLSKRI